MLQHRFETAGSFAEFAERAEKNASLWRDTYRLARVPADAAERLAGAAGHWHLLVILEDWCGDAVNSVPVLARLTELVPNADLRVVGRDANPDLMDLFLTNGKRSVPLVIVLDENYVERGRWGPRPSELQQWVEREGMQIEPTERYRHIRMWYARDRGRTTVEEVVGVITCAADLGTLGTRADR